MAVADILIECMDAGVHLEKLSRGGKSCWLKRLGGHH